MELTVKPVSAPDSEGCQPWSVDVPGETRTLTIWTYPGYTSQREGCTDWYAEVQEQVGDNWHTVAAYEPNGPGFTTEVRAILWALSRIVYGDVI